MRVLTPLDDLTMAERQQYAADDVQRLGPAVQIGFKNETDALQRTRELTALGLSILVYLVTDNLDSKQTVIKQASRRSRQRRHSETTGGQTTVIQVGYHIGAALRAAKKQHDSHKSGDGKRTVTPHVRRAHIHTFRRGKGRTERFLKWLPPIAVNAGKTPEKTQVHFPR